MNPSYNFTDTVRRALQEARDVAAGLKHEYVGTEHILLALVRNRDAVAMKVLVALSVDPDEIRQRIDGTLSAGNAAVSMGSELPYTSKAKKVLECAMRSAVELNPSYVGTEHLLIGLLREERGIAAQVLTSLGITHEELTAATIRVIRGDATAVLEPAAPTFTPRGIQSPVRVLLRVSPNVSFLIAVLALVIAIVALIVALR